jgi:hypothetical protein
MQEIALLTPDQRAVRLVRSVRAGNFANVERLLELGCNLEHTDRHGKTPLFHAIRDGNPGMTELLINAGANVNAFTPQGETPLHLAAGANRREITLQLIAADARLEAVNAVGETPLIAAIKNASATTAIILINAGANINAQDSSEQTPLKLARAGFTRGGVLLPRYLEIIERLIPAGGNLVANAFARRGHILGTYGGGGLARTKRRRGSVHRRKLKSRKVQRN